MWKDKGIRNRVKKGVYSTFLVTGLNLDRLLNTLKKEDITLCNVKKTSNKTIYITIKIQEVKKFFAITKDMCYNIQKVKTSGRAYPLLYLYKNLGLLIGSLIIIATAFLSNDLVFDVSFEGTGAVYKREVQTLLHQKGVHTFSRFSSLNLKRLGSEILSSTDRLSYASCQKVGNTLKVNLVLSSQPIKSLTGDCQNLIAQEDSVIMEIKAYRGSPLVGVGDSVKKGDVIIGGYKEIGENTIVESVVAVVKIKTQRDYQYVSKLDGEEDLALMLATESVSEGEVINSTVQKTMDGDKFIYLVQMEVVKIISVG